MVHLNPCELEIDLFCKGLRIGHDAAADAALAPRTRAGLGSGLELILPGTWKDVWVNAPVTERFTGRSCYTLHRAKSGFFLRDESRSAIYPVRLNPRPAWYDRTTSRGTPMKQVGRMQGTYLGIYIGPVCRYWLPPVKENCRFCTTGLNVGSQEILKKTVEDVVETCLAARRESGITFVHLNSGYQEGRDLQMARPFVRAVKEHTGLMVGLQMAPVSDLTQYDELIEMGVDHFSFCFEFMDNDVFSRLCPGKARTLGQESFFRAMQYTSDGLGRGRVSGEIIAGVEPLEATFEAIDRITDAGAFPTVCVFRPLEGSDMEDVPPPEYEAMRRVFVYMVERCMARRIPIGIAPNIEVSLVVQPTDALYLAPSGLMTYGYRTYNRALAAIAYPFITRRMSKIMATTRSHSEKSN